MTFVKVSTAINFLSISTAKSSISAMAGTNPDRNKPGHPRLLPVSTCRPQPVSYLRRNDVGDW